MRYRVVTERVAPKSASEALRRPQRPPAAQRPPEVAVRRRAARLGPRAAVFSPVAWPGTRRDVSWSSPPRVGRWPSGWAGVGFHA